MYILVLENLYNDNMKLEKMKTTNISKQLNSQRILLKIKCFPPAGKVIYSIHQNMFEGVRYELVILKNRKGLHQERPTVNCLPLVLPNLQQNGLPMQVTTAWRCGFRSKLRSIS